MYVSAYAMIPRHVYVTILQFLQKTTIKNLHKLKIKYWNEKVLFISAQKHIIVVNVNVIANLSNNKIQRTW